MGGGLNTALELLVLGMAVVFSVLLFLMFIMQIMSGIVNFRLAAKAKPAVEESIEEELAVIMAILNEVNPGHEVSSIQLKLIQ